MLKKLPLFEMFPWRLDAQSSGNQVPGTCNNNVVPELLPPFESWLPERRPADYLSAGQPGNWPAMCNDATGQQQSGQPSHWPAVRDDGTGYN